MPIKEKIALLNADRNPPCLSICMTTHRTFPDNKQDRISLKNLLREAEMRLVERYGKREAQPVLDKIDTISDDINFNYSLDSMYVFLSEDTTEVIRSPWTIHHNEVVVGDRFSTDHLRDTLSRNREYLILLLSQSGVSLYDALNDGISEEIRNDDFPFEENPHYITDKLRASDTKQVDNKIRHYLNKVDKAVGEVYRESGLKTLVICTETNYSRLLQVADNEDIYLGYSPVNYNDVSLHSLGKQAWNHLNG